MIKLYDKDKNILITGVAGNIGSRLSKYLLKTYSNVKIIGVDNYLSGKKQNIESLINNENFTFYLCDCNEIDQLNKIFENNKIDYIFHYAACAGVDRTLKNPDLVFKDFEGIKNISSLSRKFKVKKIAYSSSSEVYGEPISLPLTVNLSPINAKLPYASIKATSECYIRTFHQNSETKYIIFRFFNTYGPEQSSEYVIKRFLERAKMGDDLEIYGSGDQIRTFLYSDDNVEATSKMMFSDYFYNKTINIGSSKIYSILELAKIIIEVTSSKSSIIFLNKREIGDANLRQPENSEFLKFLGRQPTSLHEGLILTSEFL